MSKEETKVNTNDQEEGSEYNTLIEHYKKLIEYKNNLVKTDALLAIEKDAAVQEEIKKVKNSLLQAISYEDDVIKFTQTFRARQSTLWPLFEGKSFEEIAICISSVKKSLWYRECLP